MSVAEHSYLIIGGAPKAGTTSVFRYLAAHPDVCVSSLKETRFFLDTDYPLPAPVRFNKQNLGEYGNFYSAARDHEANLRVEATPDYLYSKTALGISKVLPHSKIIFILRDPVERMVSWYKYARQRSLLESQTTFEDYVLSQVGQRITSNTPVHLRALDQGRYEKYLPGFRQAWEDRCATIDFADLRKDPRSVMLWICAFVGLDPVPYDTYTFAPPNVSHAVRVEWINKLYTAIRQSLFYRLHAHPNAINLLKKPNWCIKKMLSANVKKAPEISISAELVYLIRRESNLTAHTHTHFLPPDQTLSSVLS